MQDKQVTLLHSHLLMHTLYVFHFYLRKYVKLVIQLSLEYFFNASICTFVTFVNFKVNLKGYGELWWFVQGFALTLLEIYPEFKVIIWSALNQDFFLLFVEWTMAPNTHQGSIGEVWPRITLPLIMWPLQSPLCKPNWDSLGWVGLSCTQNAAKKCSACGNSFKTFGKALDVDLLKLAETLKSV